MEVHKRQTICRQFLLIQWKPSQHTWPSRLCLMTRWYASICIHLGGARGFGRVHIEVSGRICCATRTGLNLKAIRLGRNVVSCHVGEPKRCFCESSCSVVRIELENSLRGAHIDVLWKCGRTQQTAWVGNILFWKCLKMWMHETFSPKMSCGRGRTSSGIVGETEVMESHRFYMYVRQSLPLSLRAVSVAFAHTHIIT